MQLSRQHLSVVGASVGTAVVIVALFVAMSLGLTNAALGATGDPSPGVSGTAFPGALGTGVSAGHFAQVHNVVLLLADDLDAAAFAQVPRLQALRSQGTYLTNFVVTDSLCCPSRTSLFRGQYVHNHKVVSNAVQSGGGFGTFYARRLQQDCLPTWLKAAGIKTGFVGKYLNGYPTGAPSKNYVPPGWADFVSPTSGNQAYSAYNYTLNINGTSKKYGNSPADFLNDVLTKQATNFIAGARRPFFLELATYNPHTPFPVAPRHATSHLGAQVPRVPSFNVATTNPPTWLARFGPIGPARVAKLDALWRRRLQSAESVADSYDALVATLRATGHLNDTMIVITGDNGYHAGTHQLTTGKLTPYREDTVEPALFLGPGIVAGTQVDQMTSMVDFAPTFAELLHAQTPAWLDGRSLLPLLDGSVNPPWRTAVLSENLSRTQPGDPDYSAIEAPVFHSLRSQDWLYVEYADGERELYDLRNDPFEMHNVVDSTDPQTVAELHAQLIALSACAGDSCRVADSMIVNPPGPYTPNPSASDSTSPTPVVSPVATSSPMPTVSPTAGPTLTATSPVG